MPVMADRQLCLRLILIERDASTTCAMDLEPHLCRLALHLFLLHHCASADSLESC